MSDDGSYDRSVSPLSSDEIKTNSYNKSMKQFIRTFETLPELWDVTRVEYRSKDSRNEALDQLLTIQRKWKPDATRDDVRKKINSLRSNFRKELKKIEESKHLGKKYSPKSTTFKALGFLCNAEEGDDNVKPSPKVKKTFSTDSRSTAASSFSYFVNPEDIEYTSRQKQENCTTEKQTHVLEKAYTLLSQCQKLGNAPQVEPLAVVWTQKLQSLDPTQRLYAEKAINDILFEAQLNNLQRDSVQIKQSDFSK